MTERPTSRVLSWPEAKNRSPRYQPRNQRDTILLRNALGERESHHQDADLALVEAQQAALNATTAGYAVEVVRRPIGIGREAVLYRVVRDEDGTVLTHAVDLED